MFRCVTCKKIYHDPVKYCDCGSDMFERVESVAEPAAKTGMSIQELVSWFIFVLCVVCAVLVWFI